MPVKFRPPLLREVDQTADKPQVLESEPPVKKRQISVDGKEDGTGRLSQLVFKKPGISSLPRKPLFVVPNPAVAAQTKSAGDGVEGYYNVLW